MSWLQLANKTAIVTGAASGIGRAVSLTLRQAGCRLILADVDKEKIEAVSSSLSSDAATAVECDVTQRSQVDSLMQACPEASILINCAGITRDGFVTNLTEEEWDAVLNVNLKGTFNTCQSFLQNPKLDDCGGAAIVNVGSVVSEKGNIGQANYAASKGGVLGLTRALAKEVARRGIRVNAVVPGFIETPMSLAVPEQVLSSIEQKIALKHFGKPEDVANVIAFLASSERSRYITGETIECSGMISL